MYEKTFSVPVPIGRPDSLPNQIRQLKINESLLIPTDELTLSTRQRALIAAKRSNIKIITRLIKNEGLRIWRVIPPDVVTPTKFVSVENVERLPTEPGGISDRFADVSKNNAMANFLAKLDAKKQPDPIAAVKPKEEGPRIIYDLDIA